MTNSDDTFINLVEQHWPGISSEDAEMVLWNATCFPFGSLDQITTNIKQAFVDSAGNPHRAVDQAIELMDKALAQFNKSDVA